MFPHGLGATRQRSWRDPSWPSLSHAQGKRDDSKRQAVERVSLVGRSIALARMVAGKEICFETKGERI